jgi:carbamoyltransferase
MIITNKEKVIEKILQQEIVAIFQNSSEYGPRALGNRSLLFDPRNKNGKDIVNKIKRREWFRPFAGTVLLEHAKDWFEMGTIKESPYMSYAIPVKEDKKSIIPCITHVDGTCRIQTLTKEQNKNYYELIELFYQKTNVPIVFNTSFNLAGEPLVETKEDALDVLDRSDINYLYMPNE